MRVLFDKVRSSTTGRNTASAMVAEAVQLGLGSFAFFLLGDRIGPAEFGVYGAIIAIATLSIPIASVGARSVLMIDLTAGLDFHALWSRAVTTVILGGVVSTLFATLVLKPLLFESIDTLPFALLFGSQACFFALSEFALVSSEAHRRLFASVGMRLLSGSVRLGAVVAFLLVGQPTVESFAVFAAVGWATASIVGLAVVNQVFGAWPTFRPPTRGEVRRGLPFALGGGSASLLDAADRPMLLELGSATEAGNYNAGYRIAQMASIPIAALVKASDADFYAAGMRSRREAALLAKRLSVRAGGFGIVAGVALLIAAPVIPLVLGPEWQSAERTIQLLAPLPFIKGLQIFPANALTGSGEQSKRNLCVGLALVANIVMNLALIPLIGLEGAIVATLIAETLMAVGLWYFVLRRRSSPTQTMRHPQESS